MKKIIVSAFFILAATVMPGQAEAASCNFYRDLSWGSRGDDVRCLQQYLGNSQGAYGFSYYGYADGVFGFQTRQAVTEWQTRYGLPATGAFDSMSRSKYSNLYGGSSGSNSSFYSATDEERAREKMKEALRMIDDAREEIEDHNQNTTQAKENLEGAEDDFFDAAWAFFVDRDFDDAYDLAKDALENAEDAFEDAGGDLDKDDAEEALDDARDAIEDAEDAIEDADDDGADVDEAEEVLDDARDLLEDAEDELDDKDYDDAEELAQEAEELAKEAITAIDW